ncbi:peptidoglycan-binding protein [Streptomyces sp. NPDC085946]|uniref:peptidoglycan-binding protein n=1 Tax=Streptomyces sp. NPDC085946 TaxID=3365744 RepID=UPI0037D0503C
MEQSKGHPCPECGTPRRPDNTPTCPCARRASEALRETRTAEAAAAEDFDPLRIRPYVELDGGTTAGGAPEDGTTAPAAPAHAPSPASARPPAPRSPAPQPPADATMPLRPVAPDTPGTPAPPGVPGGSPDATSVLPTPLAPPATEPSARDLSLFDRGSGEDAGTVPHGAGEERPRRGRRTAAVAVAGAVVAVVAAAGLASGLLSYESPSRDAAAPDGVRASVPDTSSGPPSAVAPPATASEEPESASPSPSPSASASGSPSPSPSPSASSASPSTTRPAEPTSAAPTPTGTQEPTEASDEDDRRRDGPVLRRGDRGPEVTELQLRLRQLYLYNDEASGYFSPRVEEALRNYQWARGISADELGVYGPATRTRLESETREP